MIHFLVMLGLLESMIELACCNKHLRGYKV